MPRIALGMRKSYRHPRTFVSLTGPAGNLGDALIRRLTLAWMRDTSDVLVVYVGEAPTIWLRQVGIRDDAIVLRTKRSVPRWLWMLVTAPRGSVLTFEAGEVPLDKGNGLRELVFLGETLAIRLRGGIVVRPPRGIRAPSQPSTLLHTLAARMSTVSLWRDRVSREIAGTGDLAPDIGFAAGIRTGSPDADRDELIVSLRGTRPHPGADWVDGIRSAAEQAGLRTRTVVQVREDEDRARVLAEELGGTHSPWAGADPIAHEESLRAHYDRARIVVSDRLHVLILASLSGAVPVELVPQPTSKITEAFNTIGYSGLSINTADNGDIGAVIAAQLERTAELRGCVAEAERRLAALEATIRGRILAARRTAIRTARA